MREVERRALGSQARRRVVAEMVRAEPGVLHVCGGCMAPVLADDSEIRLTKKDPWPGDVVAVSRRDGGILVHRFLVKRPWFDSAKRGWVWLAVTRPDQGKGFDPEVPVGNLLGVVSEVRGRKGQPFGVFGVGVLDRLRALGWVGRYIMRRGVSWMRGRLTGRQS